LFGKRGLNSTEVKAMEKSYFKDIESCKSAEKKEKTYTPYPGADEKYEDDSDWRLYNPDKYRDPNWSPDKE